jgi:hypothetical protein
MTAVAVRPVHAELVEPADQLVDLCPPDHPAHTALVRLPDTPGQQWLIVAVPVDDRLLDDPGITARQVAMDVAVEARDTAERIVYPIVLERRRG